MAFSRMLLIAVLTAIVLAVLLILLLLSGKKIPNASAHASYAPAAPAARPKFCTECGAPVSGSAPFCTECGAHLGAGK